MPTLTCPSSVPLLLSPFQTCPFHVGPIQLSEPPNLWAGLDFASSPLFIKWALSNPAHLQTLAPVGSPDAPTSAPHWPLLPLPANEGQQDPALTSSEPQLYPKHYPMCPPPPVFPDNISETNPPLYSFPTPTLPRLSFNCPHILFNCCYTAWTWEDAPCGIRGM